jgi:apolipoprotein N-acyltransferase
VRDRDDRTICVWRLVGVLFVEPLLWCGFELVRSRLFGGFAWNPLGVVLANFGFGAPAALGGVYLCSAVVVLINGTFAGIAERVWRPERSGFPGLRKFGTLETLLAFAIVAGVYSAAKIEREGRRDARDGSDRRDEFLKVAMIQRNYPCVFQKTREDPVAAYSNLLQNVAFMKPDLVVMSESALCEFGAVDRPQAYGFAAFVRRMTGAALLAGGSRVASAEGGARREYNSAALYTWTQPEQRWADLQTYDKVHLVPFGEFIPGDKVFPALQKLAPVGSCTPGELKVLDFDLRRGHRPRPTPTEPTSPISPASPIPPVEPIEPISLGVAICFEDTDSAQMRWLAAKGARVLFFITNDSWFSKSDEAWAHAWQATARAIETGLPVVRVGNSGVTGTIAPDGKATWLLGADGRPLVDRRGTMCDRVPLAADGAAPTFYVLWGDAPLAASFALLLIAMLVARVRRPSLL